MIVNNAQTVLYNGTPVQAVLCNGVKVWPNDGYRVYISNSGASANKIGIGLSAYMGDALIYSQAPVSGSSYSSDELPSGARVEVCVTTPIYKKVGYSADGVEKSFTQRNYDTSQSAASSTYSALIASDSNVLVKGITNNGFSASGATSISRIYSTNDAGGGFGYPLWITAMSGDPTVSAIRKMRCSPTYSTTATASGTYFANKPYSSVYTNGSFLVYCKYGQTGHNALVTGHLYMGVGSASGHTALNSAASASASLYRSRTSSTYRPSSTSFAAADSFGYWATLSLSTTTPNLNYACGISGTWHMSGLAP